MKNPVSSFFLCIFFFISFLGSASPVDGPTHVSISGKITDKNSGEALVGATVFVKELKSGAVSDMYGNYSLTLNIGTWSLVYSYVGYKTVYKTLELDPKSVLKINQEMEPLMRDLKEVEITSEKNDKNVVKPEMSTFRMDIKTIQHIPALFGEVDVIKAIQMLPGVQSVGEGSSGFSVRGGAPTRT